MGCRGMDMAVDICPFGRIDEGHQIGLDRRPMLAAGFFEGLRDALALQQSQIICELFAARGRKQ